MGKLAVYKYFSFLFLIATFAISTFTFFGLFGGNVPPAGNSAQALLVYVLPLFIAANVVMLLYWLIRRRWHWAAIPLLTLLCCIPYMGTLVQFGSQDKEADKHAGIKIATYNVAMFGRETTGFIAQDILAEMRRQKVEVLCLQEYTDNSGDQINSESYKEYFPYMAKGRSDMMIFSRYPIRESKTINFEMTNNSAMWAEIDVKGRDVRVYNVHLETTGLNGTLHKAAKAQMQGLQIENNRLLKAIYGNYTMGMVIRSGQAEMVAQDIQNTPADIPVIVCGDFNDVPYSYVYKTMLGDLVDGFKECGHGGWMYTFRGGRKIVRIDYIFHSEQLKGLDYYKYELTYSDHFPVFMKLEFKE
jgi:endonuclease/exonuclease/phosphatase family metal-dependent hydrolase